MKTALITGASGGIGCALVKKFVDSGYFVLGQYNQNEKGILSLISELKNADKADYFCTVKADLNEMSGVQAVVNSAMQNFGHIDVLINNAGTDLYKLCTDTTEEEFDKIMGVNLKAPYFLTSMLLEQMINRKYGKIIFISSIWGKVGGAMESAYSASKSALIGLTKSLAKEVGRNRITVNCICPGVIDTPMNARFDGREILDLKERTPLYRLGSVEDVANLAGFLASGAGDFITGQAITSDGGFTL